jgi:uncharacterized membrane protein YidH (DUF202 family)
VPIDPVPGPDGEWDEGLAPERTQLAWSRSGLAVVVAVGVLARRVWTLHDGAGVAALVVVGVGALVWLFGMRISRRAEQTTGPPGRTGRRPFGLITVGTVLLAAGGLALGFVHSS